MSQKLKNCGHVKQPRVLERKWQRTRPARRSSGWPTRRLTQNIKDTLAMKCMRQGEWLEMGHDEIGVLWRNHYMIMILGFSSDTLGMKCIKQGEWLEIGLDEIGVLWRIHYIIMILEFSSIWCQVIWCLGWLVNSLQDLLLTEDWLQWISYHFQSLVIMINKHPLFHISFATFALTPALLSF